MKKTAKSKKRKVSTAATAARAKAGARMKRLTTIAKQIRKVNPRKKWQTCIKEAAKKL